MMHPRNPYRKAQDFQLLASKCPPLQPHVNKKGRLDFLDPAAQRALTKAILKTDFDLEVELPDDRLCPPVPNRLNYVLWIEDIIEAMREHTKPSGSVSGLDVGTGASAIYPLLCCRQNPTWEMFATEIDPVSLSCAQRNVSTNGLDSRIHISHATANDSDPSSPSSRIFGPPFADPTLEIDFTMCNPPFYSSAAEIQSSKAEKEDEAFSVCTGSSNEMVYSPPSLSSSATSSSPYAEFEREGGEVAFVARMVEESLVIRRRCGWCTSMLGKMSSVPKLVGLLKAVGISNYAATQFVQGQTRRWAVGWSVDEWWRLPDSISRLSHLPSSHPLAKVQPVRTTLEYFLEKDPATVLHDTLQGMKHGDTLEVESVDASSRAAMEFLVKARENTWSRAARRKMKQGQQASSIAAHNDPSGSTLKRKRDGDDSRDASGTSRKKKGRLDRSNEPDEYKMICTVSLLAPVEEGDETTSKRWILRVQARDAVNVRSIVLVLLCSRHTHPRPNQSQLQPCGPYVDLTSLVLPLCLRSAIVCCRRLYRCSYGFKTKVRLLTTPEGSMTSGAIAKWLRRQIRNLFLFEGAGSSPAGVEFKYLQATTDPEHR